MGSAAAAVAVAVIGTGISMEKQRKAASAEKKGRKIARSGEAAAEARGIRQQIREERIRRAQIIAAAETSGVAGASSEAGSLSSMRSVVGSNIAFSKGQGEVADAVSSQLQSAANWNRWASNTTALTGLAVDAVGLLPSDKKKKT